MVSAQALQSLLCHFKLYWGYFWLTRSYTQSEYGTLTDSNMSRMTLTKRKRPNGILFGDQKMKGKINVLDMIREKVRSVVDVGINKGELILKGTPIETHDLFYFKDYNFRLLICRLTNEVLIFPFVRLTKSKSQYKAKIDLKGMSVWETKAGLFDGFPFPLLLVMNPDVGRWFTVSLLGHLYEYDYHTESVGKKTDILNVVTHGSIIVSGSALMRWTTGKKPVELDWTCPITLDTIPTQSIHDPIAPHCRKKGNAKETKENRPWYFSCGHVFSYQPLIVDKCPVCRSDGVYKPLVLASDYTTDPLLYSSNTTLEKSRTPLKEYAFNPCGHLTTEKESFLYSQDVKLPVGGKWIHACPYCLTEITSICKLYFVA